jgi:hypothetical protein
VSPKRYYEEVLQGHDVAQGDSFFKQAIFIANSSMARVVLGNEEQSGMVPAWPKAFSE